MRNIIILLSMNAYINLERFRKSTNEKNETRYFTRICFTADASLNVLGHFHFVDNNK